MPGGEWVNGDLGDWLVVFLFWIRELAGWALVIVGLSWLYRCLDMLESGRPVTAGTLAFIAVMVFRGGIHLIKVGSAACLVQRAHEKERP